MSLSQDDLDSLVKFFELLIEIDRENQDHDGLLDLESGTR